VLIYLGLNLGRGGAPGGWPVVVATDMAVALAALAWAAPRLPPPLRVFLLTVAIVDDVAAVGVIGVVYTGHVHWAALTGAGAALAALAMLSRWRRAPLLFYAGGIVLAWGFCLKSGIDTSLAGVACALTVPVGARRAGGESVLKLFMDSLHPYVAFGVLPLFAFTAAGISLAGVGGRDLVSPVTLGVILALLVGKPLGVFGFSLVGAASRLARRPTGTTWLELLGVAILCGAGFTMSLYLAALAFGRGDATEGSLVRLAALAASVLSVAGGGAVLAWALRRRDARGEEALD